MNAWTLDQLFKLDMRSEKCFKAFENYANIRPAFYKNYLEISHKKLKCCYNCQCNIKCRLNILHVLEDCEVLLTTDESDFENDCQYMDDDDDE